MKLCTHDGRFHADEAIACYILKSLHEYNDLEVIRSRDPAIISSADIVVDVGGEYDPQRMRFDHHQRSFCETFGPGKTTKLSSAGLVFKQLHPLLGLQDLDTVFERLYDVFIEEADAVDNGIPSTKDVPAFKTGASSIFSRVQRLNPSWIHSSKDTADSLFLKAISLCGALFLEVLDDIVNNWLPARSIVLNAITDRHNVDASGSVIVLAHACPWMDHLFDIEIQLALENTILYVIYCDVRSKNGTSWMAQAVPVFPDSFESRKPFPSEWRGLRGDDLAKVTGIVGVIFTHSSGFLSGAHSLEAIQKMVSRSLLA